MEVSVTHSWWSNEVIGLGLTCYPHIRHVSQPPTYQASSLPSYWAVYDYCILSYPCTYWLTYCLPSFCLLDLHTLRRNLKVIICRKRHSPSSEVRLLGNIHRVSFGDMLRILKKKILSKRIFLMGHQEADGDHMLKEIALALWWDRRSWGLAVSTFPESRVALPLQPTSKWFLQRLHLR